MVFLPHTKTVILLEPYCGTMTEPGLPVVPWGKIGFVGNLVSYNSSEGFNVLKCVKHWLELMPHLRSEVIPAVTDLLPQFG